MPGRIPDWLPCHAKAYIVGHLIFAEPSPSKVEKDAIHYILPAFRDKSMQDVWKKIESLSDDAVRAYTLAIASGEHNFKMAKDHLCMANQYAEKLEKINRQAQKLYALIQVTSANYPWFDANLTARAQSISENAEINYKAAQAVKYSATSPNPPQYYGRLTRKQAGKAKEIFFARSLSRVIRYYSDTRSPHDEAAITVNALWY